MSEPSVTRPEVSPPGPWEFPLPQTTRLDNGLTVHVYDIPGQYVVSARLVVPVSTRAEPREAEGVAALMSRLLDEGTDTHSSEEFTELLERHGIDFGATLTEAGMTVHLEVASRQLGTALELLLAAVARPSFPEREVSRLVRTRLAEFEQERASAPHRAIREFQATYFAPTERASRPSAGAPDTVHGLTREQVVAFHATHVVPNAATLILAGDMSALPVADLVAQTLASWRPGPVATPEPPRPALRAPDAARIVLVDRPGSVQSELAVGWDGPDRHVEPAWAAYPVLSFVLGGSPTARVDKVLREEKGFTYGMRSSFRPRRAGGLFLTTGSVRTEVTVEAVTLLLGILQEARSGFTAQECAAGVEFLRNTAPGRFATSDAVADEAALLALEALPLTFTTDNLAAMTTLTAAWLRDSYARFVDGSWTIVIVGDASSYAEQLRSLGCGEVHVVAN